MKKVLEKRVLWIVFITLFMACNPDLEDKSGKVLTSLQVTLSNFEGNIDTRTQESGYQTTFIGNEQIGIFSLKTSNNTVLDNNVPYKYNVSANSWQPVNAGNQIYVYGSGVTYYAYYHTTLIWMIKKALQRLPLHLLCRKIKAHMTIIALLT